MGRRVSQAIDRRISRAINRWHRWPYYRLVIRINWSRVGFALLAATATIGVVALGFQGTIERRHPQAVLAGPPAAAEVSSAPKAPASSALQLIAEPASQGTESRLALGIVVRGPSELASAAAIEIIGLPSGWALSTGRSLGNLWRIPAAQLSGTSILPPRGFSGTVDLEVELRLADDTLVERRSVRRAVTELRRAMTDPAAQETTLLLGKAEALLVQRDVSAARLVLRHAAETGNARAALLLGGTYEGCVLWPSQLCNTDEDRAAAQVWYEKAAKFGSAEARQRLDRLASEEPRATGRAAAAPADKVNPPVSHPNFNTPPLDARSPDVKIGVVDVRAVQERDILSKAQGLLVLRDISAARLVLRHAAEAGNARAALLLGGTYEGCMLWPSQLCNTDEDRATARTWYEMAARLGSAEARQRLDRLPGGDLPIRPITAGTVR
jgi:TPR repeat protein